VILDLCQGFYQGGPLGPGDRILSFDARPSIQARGRIHEALPAAPGRLARGEHEYLRHGALALLAGLDVHAGKVLASTPATTGIIPFLDLTGHVMARPEHKNALRVFVIVDNGSDHRGQKAIKRLARAHPNAVMIRTPVHASWLNQAEIFFSMIQKKVVSPDDFASLDQLSSTLLAFIDRCNQTARPSAGNSPPATSPLCSTASANTSEPPPRTRPTSRPPPDPPTNVRWHPLSAALVSTFNRKQDTKVTQTDAKTTGTDTKTTPARATRVTPPARPGALRGLMPRRQRCQGPAAPGGPRAAGRLRSGGGHADRHGGPTSLPRRIGEHQQATATRQAGPAQAA
jgi:hypothetical protein